MGSENGKLIKVQFCVEASFSFVYVCMNCILRTLTRDAKEQNEYVTMLIVE